MKQNLLKTMLVSVVMLAGSMGGVMAEEVTLSPTQTTVIKGDGKDVKNQDQIFYNAEATSWNCSMAQISAGAFKNSLSGYDGSPVVLTKFNATSALNGKHLAKATLKFTSQCTVASKNSNVQVATVGTSWDATTATWNATNTSAILNAENINGDGVNVGTSATDITIDVTSYLLKKTDNAIGFGIYTKTGREQAISNISLIVETSVEEIKNIKYSVNLVDENNEVIKTIYTNDDLIPGTSISYTYPKYITDSEGKVTYQCSEKSFAGSVSPTTEGQTNIKYTAYKGTAYFVEAENVISATEMLDEKYSSKAAVRGLNKDKDLFTIPESGAYRLTYAVCSNNTKASRAFILAADDDEIVNKQVDWSVNYVQINGIISEEVQAFAKGTVIKTKAMDTQIVLDYILLEKVGDAVSVSAINYASYVPTCNVVAPADVKVYTAKADVENSVIKLTEIPVGSVIPAGTAVLVGAEEGSYTFTASAETASAIGENELKAGEGAATAGDGSSIYALTEQNGKAVFARVAEGVEVPVGKAYMVIKTTGNAKYFSIGGGNGTTGINSVNAATAAGDGAYYTLQGVKVNKPATKGIYIHNGKKVIK